MSADVDRDVETETDAVDGAVDGTTDLDQLVDEVDPEDVPADAGEHGTLVVARCVGCKVVRLKRAPDDVLEDTDGRRESFKHVCHADPCRGVTWWNVVGEGGESGQ